MIYRTFQIQDVTGWSGQFRFQHTIVRRANEKGGRLLVLGDPDDDLAQEIRPEGIFIRLLELIKLEHLVHKRTELRRLQSPVHAFHLVARG